MMFVELALERLTREVRTSELRTMCLQVVVAALYYNPPVLLDALEKIHLPNTTQSITGQFLTQWIHDADNFIGLHDRKICALGLCTLLDTPGNRPQVLNELAAQILPALILVFNGLEKAYEYRAAEDDSDDEEADEDYEEGELDDEDDDIDDEGQEYIEMLQKSQASGEAGDDDDDDEFGEVEETALESYETPLDKEDCPIDEYQIFQHTLSNLRERDAAWYNLITGHLTEQHQKDLQQIFKLADQRRAALESKKIEQGGGYRFPSMQVPTTFNFGQ